MWTSTAVAVVTEDTRLRLLWDRVDLLREIDAIGRSIDTIELQFGRGAELQAARQRQHALRAAACEQVRKLLGGP